MFDRELLALKLAVKRAKQAKDHYHVRALLELFTVPGQRFDHVNGDLVGPLSLSRGHTYLLTMVDRATRCLEAVPLSLIATAVVARAFVGSWVARAGAPLDLSSDKGLSSRQSCGLFSPRSWVSPSTALQLIIRSPMAYVNAFTGL